MTSTVGFAPASVKSFPADSCFAKGILIIPYNTSAISISISSCTATGDDNLHDDDDFGGNGFCFVPDGNFFRIETLEEEGDVGAGGDGDARIEAGLTLLAGDVDDTCRWICSPEAKTPPPVVLDAHDSCGLFVQALYLTELF